MTVFERVGLGEDGKEGTFSVNYTVQNKLQNRTKLSLFKKVLKDGSHKISFLQLHLTLWQRLAS